MCESPPTWCPKSPRGELGIEEQVPHTSLGTTTGCSSFGEGLIQLESLNFPHGAMKVWGGHSKFGPDSHQQCFLFSPWLWISSIQADFIPAQKWSHTVLCEVSPSSLRFASLLAKGLQIWALPVPAQSSATTLPTVAWLEFSGSLGLRV